MTTSSTTAGPGGAPGQGGMTGAGGDFGTGGIGGTGGDGGGMGGGATGGGGAGGGRACTMEGFNLLDTNAPYDPPGLPFEHGSASIAPLAAAASVPGSPLHHWDFDPNFGSNNQANVDLELTCHGSGGSDLVLDVVEVRFTSGDWKFNAVGQAVGCGEQASFSITKPPGPEPSYVYRVRFPDGSPPQYVEYTIGAAAQYLGTPGHCVDDDIVIEPMGDETPSQGEALSSTSGTISAPFGNTFDFIAESSLVAAPSNPEVVNVTFTCQSPHLELRIVTVGDDGQLAHASLVNSNVETIACNDTGNFVINYVDGQANWFALVTVADTYDFATDGAFVESYSTTIL